MRAIVMSEPRRAGGAASSSIGPPPAPGPGEALVRVAAVAVNRLDIWVREDVGHAYGATLPIVPGYDVAGEVIEVGDGVVGRRAGSRVYVHYDFSCGRCPYCLEGDEAACADYGVMGVNHDGGYAEQIVAPVRNLFTLPDGALVRDGRRGGVGLPHRVPHALLAGRPAGGRDRARDRGRIGSGRAPRSRSPGSPAPA